MTDDAHSDAFLSAEAQATRIALEIERLAAALTSYQANSAALAASAGNLAGLASAQGEATTGMRQLTAELRRLGVAETQRRLDALAATVGGIDAAVAGARLEAAASALSIRRLALAAVALILINLGIVGILIAR